MANSKKNPLLMGRKAKSVLDTGYIFAPYIPLMASPSVLGAYPSITPNSPLEDLVNGVYEEEIEAGDLSPRRGATDGPGFIDDPHAFTLKGPLLAKYSKVLVKPEYYSTITIANL